MTPASGFPTIRPFRRKRCYPDAPGTGDAQLHRSFHADGDPAAGGRVRLAAADHRLPARARAVPQAAQGAAGRRPALCAQAAAASGGGRDHRRAGRVVRSRHHRRDPAGHAARHRPGALHPHASDQARHRHPQRAASRREDLRRGQSRTRCASSSAYRDQAELLLRVSFRSPGAVVDLSRKFGCDPEDLIELARLARKLAIPVRGLSFHVGSQAADPGKHVEAIEVCAQAHGAGAPRETRRRSTRWTSAADIPIEYGQKVADIGRFCAPDPRRAGQTPARVRVIAEPGPLHLRSGGHRRGLGHGPREARRPLVVLPRRRPVRFVQRPVVRPRQVPGRSR